MHIILYTISFSKLSRAEKKCSFKINAKSVCRSPNNFLLIVPKKFANVLSTEGFKLFKWTHRLQFQHFCRKMVDPRSFLTLRKFLKFSIFFLFVPESFSMSLRRFLCVWMDASNALLTCLSKIFGQTAENVSLMLKIFEQNAKNLQSMSRNEKKKKNNSGQKSSKNFLDTPKAFRKSSLQKLLLKV